MNYTILIADDEPEIRTLLRLYLENENYQIIEAEIMHATDQYLWAHRRFKTRPPGENSLYK